MAVRLPDPISVSSYNAGDGPDIAKERDVERLAKVSDLICAQEMSDRQGLRLPVGWLRWDGTGKLGQAATPILYHHSLKVTKKDSFLLSPAMAIPNSGPGPDHVKPKWGNYIKASVGGRAVRFVCFHGVTEPHHDKVRGSLAKMQQDNLLKFSDQHPFGLMVIVGDFNMNPDDSFLKPLRAKFDLVTTGPTHGRNTYDMVWVRKAPRRVTATHPTVIRETSSDHDSPLVTLLVKPLISRT